MGQAAADPTHAGPSHLPLELPYLPGRVLPSFPCVSRMTRLPAKAAVLEEVCVGREGIAVTISPLYFKPQGWDVGGHCLGKGGSTPLLWVGVSLSPGSW